jgi:ABC-type proline/glycine betaine transport system permease subunit
LAGAVLVAALALLADLLLDHLQRRLTPWNTQQLR